MTIDQHITSTKICRFCGQEKPIEQFRICNPRKGQRRTECRECQSRIDRERRRGGHSIPPESGGFSPDNCIVSGGYDWTWAFVVFREHPAYPGRFFGTDGSYWIRQRTRYIEEWKRGKPFLGQRGYYVVGFQVGPKMKTIKLHRLILETFIGPSLPDTQGCHNNDDKTDNRLVNLRWDTAKANYKDATDNGRMPVGSRHWKSKLTEDAVMQIRELRADGVGTKVIAVRFGVSISSVRRIVQGRFWKHVQR